jgi:hypothetical protein
MAFVQLDLCLIRQSLCRGIVRGKRDEALTDYLELSRNFFQLGRQSLRRHVLLTESLEKSLNSALRNFQIRRDLVTLSLCLIQQLFVGVLPVTERPYELR